jgi:hypothetical protein
MEFIELVAKMREAQKEYFRSRTPEALKWSKSLEGKVDYLIATKDNLKLFE